MRRTAKITAVPADKQRDIALETATEEELQKDVVNEVIVTSHVLPNESQFAPAALKEIAKRASRQGLLSQSLK
jgi:hypothetical protein